MGKKCRGEIKCGGNKWQNGAKVGKNKWKKTPRKIWETNPRRNQEGRNMEKINRGKKKCGERKPLVLKNH